MAASFQKEDSGFLEKSVKYGNADCQSLFPEGTFSVFFFFFYLLTNTHINIILKKKNNNTRHSKNGKCKFSQEWKFAFLTQLELTLLGRNDRTSYICYILYSCLGAKKKIIQIKPQHCGFSEQGEAKKKVFVT